MHVQCADEKAGSALLQAAFECGFRESGMRIGVCLASCARLPSVPSFPVYPGNKVMVAIRTTAMCIETPVLAYGGSGVDDFLVEAPTLQFLVARANQLFDMNAQLTSRLFTSLQTVLGMPHPVGAVPSPPALPRGDVVCSVCCSGFPSKNKLFVHLRQSPGCATPAPAPAAPGVLCSGCQTVFPSRNALFKHLRAGSCGPSQASARPASLSGAALSLQWLPLSSDAKLVSRWGHTSSVVRVGEGQPRIVVFGGFHGSDCHARTNDVVVFDCAVQRWARASVAAGSPLPTPRMLHAACVLPSFLDGGTDVIVVVGGRGSPQVGYSDVWALTVVECSSADELGCRWFAVSLPATEESALRDRWGHSVVVTDPVAGTALVFGGRNSASVFGDVLQVKLLKGDGCLCGSVSNVTPSGIAPSPRFGHASIRVAFNMVVHGGYTVVGVAADSSLGALPLTLDSTIVRCAMYCA